MLKTYTARDLLPTHRAQQRKYGIKLILTSNCSEKNATMVIDQRNELRLNSRHEENLKEK